MKKIGVCNAKVRPAYCRYHKSINICCLGCRYNNICRARNHIEGYNLIPCTREHVTNIGECHFLELKDKEVFIEKNHAALSGGKK